MKKIIAAFDGLKFSRSTCSYAIEVAQKTKAHLVGIFLDDFTYHSYSIYELIRDNGGISKTIQNRLETKDEYTRAKSAAFFSAACEKAGISYSTRTDRGFALKELLYESIYADLLVISNNETFTRYPEKAPSRFIKEIQSDLHCPVLMVPSNYTPMSGLLLLYDGEPESVFAIRSISALFDNPGKMPVESLSVVSAADKALVPDAALMREFMKRHYPEARFKVLKGSPQKMIIQYIKKKEPGVLVVLGAYRRNAVSQFFKESLATALTRELNVPLYIPHR